MSLEIHNDIKNKLNYFKKKNKLPNIIIHGPVGSGKKKLLFEFINSIYNNDISSNDVSSNDVSSDDVSSNDVSSNDVWSNDVSSNTVSTNDVNLEVILEQTVRNINSGPALTSMINFANNLANQIIENTDISGALISNNTNNWFFGFWFFKNSFK